MPSSASSSWGQALLAAGVGDEPWLCVAQVPWAFAHILEMSSRGSMPLAGARKGFCGSLLQRGWESAGLQAARWLHVLPLPCGICLLETRRIIMLEARGHQSLSADGEYLLRAASQLSGGGCRLGCLSGG